jgi:hypothetical protein
VAELVVHGLETVEVDEADDQIIRQLLATVERLADVIHQPATVRQSRELIDLGLLAELALGRNLSVRALARHSATTSMHRHRFGPR